MMVDSKKSDQITIGYEKITSEFILEHGKESLLILTLLSRHYSIRGQLVFNLKYIYDKIGVPLNKKDRKDRIVDCINSIFDTKVNTNINEITTIPYIIEPGQYLILTDEEVDVILNYDKRVDKFNLFNTYIAIKRYLNYKTKTSYPPITMIMDLINVKSNNAIASYIEILEELKMIECTRSDKYIVCGSEIKRPNNEYRIIYQNNS